MMKTMILATVIGFLIASPVHAVPLTWVFSGTTLSNSGFIDENDVLRDLSSRPFKFRIFLDTDLMGQPVGGGAAEINFFDPTRAPFKAEIDIAGLVLPATPVSFVDYAGGRSGFGLPGVDFKFELPLENPAHERQGISFVSPVSIDDALHLVPISPTEVRAGGGGNPLFDNILTIVGPNLLVFGEVTLFTATVPEGGSTLLFLSSGLVALGLLRRRYKPSVS